MADERLTVGEFAAAAGITVSTLHYWEKAGLLVSASRSEGGYRLYRPDQVPEARWIRKMQSLGFLSQQIRRLQAIAATPDDLGQRVEQVEQVYRRHRDEVERKAQHYATISRRLRDVKPAELLPGAEPSGG